MIKDLDPTINDEKLELMYEEFALILKGHELCVISEALRLLLEFILTMAEKKESSERANFLWTKIYTTLEGFEKSKGKSYDEK